MLGSAEAYNLQNNLKKPREYLEKKAITVWSEGFPVKRYENFNRGQIKGIIWLVCVPLNYIIIIKIAHQETNSKTDVGGKIILKLIFLEIQSGFVWTGFIWFRVGISGGLL
jgi:hypothetical protein